MSTVVPEPDKRPLASVARPHESGRLATVAESEETMIIHVSALAYLRTMWSLLWTAFRHPFTTTYIDAATGKVLDRYEEEA
jgi:hypothetical protein